MNNIIVYKGFELEVLVDGDYGLLRGKLLPSEDFKENEVLIRRTTIESANVDDIWEQFKKIIDEFLETVTITITHEGAVLEVYKSGSSLYYTGNIKHEEIWQSGKIPVFYGDTLCEIESLFINYIRELEDSIKIYQCITGKKLGEEDESQALS